MFRRKARHQRRAGAFDAYRSLPPRLRSLCDAASEFDGDLGRVEEVLDLGCGRLTTELSRLRSRGFGWLARLYDPRALGRACECVTFVRLDLTARETADEFERACREDPTITCAVLITGRFHYRLTTFHRDHAEASRWRRVLAARPAVLEIVQRQVTTVRGDQVAGLVLRTPAKATVSK